MRKTEYICDWCRTTISAERGNQFSVQPMFVLTDTPSEELPASPSTGFDAANKTFYSERKDSPGINTGINN